MRKEPRSDYNVRQHAPMNTVDRLQVTASYLALVSVIEMSEPHA